LMSSSKGLYIHIKVKIRMKCSVPGTQKHVKV
jgi:hypothetical protein